MRTEKPYIVDTGVPSDVEEGRLREAEQQVTEEQEIEAQRDERDDEDILVMATNFPPDARLAKAMKELFPTATVVHRRINQETAEVEW